MIILGTLSEFNFASYTMYNLQMVWLLQLNLNYVLQTQRSNMWYYTGDICVNV